MKLFISKEGTVMLDDVSLENVKKVDIKNINPISPAEVQITLAVDEIDVQYVPWAKE